MARQVKPTLYINLRQAADYLGISNVQRISRMIARGEIEAFVVRNEENSRRNQWQVSFNSVEKWRKENQ